MEFLFLVICAMVGTAIARALSGNTNAPQQRQPMQQSNGPGLLGTAAAVAGGMIVGDMVTDAMADEPAAESPEAAHDSGDMGDFGDF